jgi:hypothetical protein
MDGGARWDGGAARWRREADDDVKRDSGGTAPCFYWSFVS